jgi:hypothetical protein
LVLQDVLENLEPNFGFGGEKCWNSDLDLQVYVQEHSVQVQGGFKQGTELCHRYIKIETFFGLKV